MAGVLQGVRVVEFTHMVAGPACGQVLGDFGAEVLKVEPPQGDITRRMGPMAGNVAALYASTNRNKQVVCLDLTDPSDAAEARQLALGADVVISNLDAALLQKAGLDAPALRRANPRLICVEVTGFGPGGPAGTDGLAQAAMGLMATTGSVEGPSFRTGPSVVDVSTGVWAALGVFAALENRRRTGQGEFIQASLADTCLYLQYPHLTMYAAAPDVVRRNGNHSVVACTPLFDAADGRLLVTVLHQRHWQALCEVAGVPKHADDPDFASNALRCAAQSRIESLLNPLMRQRTRAEWVALLRAARLPCGPERDYAEVTEDADLHARGMLYRLPQGDGESLQVGMPLQFTTMQAVAPQPPPMLPHVRSGAMGESDAGE
ncbi:MAG: CoA:oxalate CoA-transferase [Methylobacteriaceae bacterium]|jgi:crotonobetainyl-CoA:carnitine CoA-transferase CaiB-like acyl-CoA transferase|nr:CoA:oxalate CoA-transferase [Methylobacteriaceae bacterium]